MPVQSGSRAQGPAAPDSRGDARSHRRSGRTRLATGLRFDGVSTRAEGAAKRWHISSSRLRHLRLRRERAEGTLRPEPGLQAGLETGGEDNVEVKMQYGL